MVLFAECGDGYAIWLRPRGDDPNCAGGGQIQVEPHRRPGLLLHQGVRVPPEARLHRHDAAGAARAHPVHLHDYVHRLPHRMRRLSAALQGTVSRDEYFLFILNLALYMYVLSVPYGRCRFQSFELLIVIFHLLNLFHEISY